MSREREASEQNIERERELSELRFYRAIESKRLKWEVKEARLIAQLEVRNTRDVTREITAGVPLVTTPSTVSALQLERDVGSTVVCTEPRAATCSLLKRA